jgi:hypothetical protein
MKSLLRILAFLTLGLGGAIAWGSSTGILNPRVEPALEELPLQFGPLRHVLTHDVDSGLLGDLPPDLFTFQDLSDEAGNVGKLYIAYYKRGRRWSGRPHDLTICYRAIGYDMLGGRLRRLGDGSEVWMRRFTSTKTGEEITVVHWLQRPGLLPGHDGAADYLGRMTSLQGLRQDVASVYLEFPSAAMPGEQQLLDAAQAVIDSLATVWKGPTAAQDS